MSQIERNAFLDLALAEVPRLLGQVNRNPSSKSYGSFDRAYWHYRTNTISSARYQEAALTLALLYTNDFPQNDFFEDENILDIVCACIRFTQNIQHVNGSFDEWYVNEGSYVCTAFVTAAYGEMLELFKKNEVRIPEMDMLEEIVDRGANYLASTSEVTVLNQVSGAILGMSLAVKFADRSDLTDVRDELLETFLDAQSSEGWWSEYGGPDAGYLTLAISYLEKYRRLTNDSKVDEPLARAKKYVLSFAAPDKTVGGEYMSRNTEYIVPSTNLPYIGAITPKNLDDRYLCYILYNWIQAGLRMQPELLPKKEGEKFYKESGTYRHVGEYFLYANAKKGNSFRLYANGKEYFDSGLEISSGKYRFTTGFLSSDTEALFEDGVLKSEGTAKKIKEPLLDAKLAVIFNAWQLMFGWLGGLQALLKKFLREKMISNAKQTDLAFSRTITEQDGKIIVQDTVDGVSSKEDILYGQKSAYSAVPSSKYGAVGTHKKNRLEPSVDIVCKENSCTITRTFTWSD